jgi:Methyltransferase domain
MPDPVTPLRAQPGDLKPDYGTYYYRHDCGVPYERNEHWLGFFGGVADAIVRDLNPKTLLDAGCAMGFLVEKLRERGVDAWGIDVSEYAISQVDESVREHCSVGSLADPLPRRYDLIVCIEVLEHLDPVETDRAIASLCAATDLLLLSSTPDDYGEASHLNVRPPEDWSALLAREGFLRDLGRDASYITPWAAVYARAEEPLPETVRRYDRAWWRLRRESTELRGSLMAAEGRLAQLEEGPEEQRTHLQAEVVRLEEEVLKLRDRLVGQDAELASAQGRVAELEHQSRRLIGAATLVRSKMSRVSRLASSLRRLRARRG